MTAEQIGSTLTWLFSVLLILFVMWFTGWLHKKFNKPDKSDASVSFIVSCKQSGITKQVSFDKQPAMVYEMATCHSPQHVKKV